MSKENEITGWVHIALAMERERGAGERERSGVPSVDEGPQEGDREEKEREALRSERSPYVPVSYSASPLSLSLFLSLSLSPLPPMPHSPSLHSCSSLLLLPGTRWRRQRAPS